MFTLIFYHEKFWAKSFLDTKLKLCLHIQTSLNIYKVTHSIQYYKDKNTDMFPENFHQTSFTSVND